MPRDFSEPVVPGIVTNDGIFGILAALSAPPSGGNADMFCYFCVHVGDTKVGT